MEEWYIILFLYMCFWFSFDTSECRQISDGADDDSLLSPSHTQTATIVAVCLSAIAFLIVVVLVVFKCGDCYNSEVSSEFHPASNGSGPKWGGAVGYSADTARGNGGITFGETYDPNSSQGLPYSMIPTNIPEQGGFAGYHTGSGSAGGDAGGGSAAPLMGYQSFNTPSAPTSGSGEGSSAGPRHYNPATDAPEPPPTYNESQRHNSLRGNR